MLRMQREHNNCQIEIKSFRQSHFKNSQTQQKFDKFLEIYENICFFLWKSVVQSSFIFCLLFYQKAYRFSTFSKYFKYF